MEQPPDTFESYLSTVVPRLARWGFSLRENVSYRNSLFRYVARKTAWDSSKGGFLETFFVFMYMQSIDTADLRRFSSKCYKYSMKARRIPLPCGLFEGVWCFPVAIVDSLSKEVSQQIRTKDAPKHWASNEFPVVYDLRSRRLHYLETTPAWGSLYYSELRTIADAFLYPVLQIEGAVSPRDAKKMPAAEMENRFLIERILHTIFLGAVFIYPIVLLVLPGTSYEYPFQENDPILSIVATTLGVISSIVLAVGLYLPRWARWILTKIGKQPKGITYPWGSFSLFIFRLALFEAIGIYGFVLGLMGGKWVIFAPFIIVAAVVLIITFPSSNRGPTEGQN